MSELKLPYEGHILLTSPFGGRTLNGAYDWHPGLDLVGQEEKVVRAAGNGVVVQSTIVTSHETRDWEWGNWVCIQVGYHYVYTCHLAERLVERGQVVKAGDPIGIEGNTGYSFGAHCHFEVRDGTRIGIDPFPLLGLPQNLNRSGVTLYNTFKKPEPEPTEDDMTGEEIYNKLIEYLSGLKESDWSIREGAFERMKELGIMDGKYPRCFLTREQDAAVMARFMDMVLNMIAEHKG